MSRPKPDPVRTARVAAALRAYVMNQGWKQSEISSKVGVPLSVVSPVLSGKRPLGYVSAKRWAKALHVSEKFLLTGEGQLVKGFPAEQSDGKVTVIAPTRAIFPSDKAYITFLETELKQKETIATNALSKITYLEKENADLRKRIFVDIDPKKNL